jgi:oligopeptide/dipeptide ABC transporter ATP-binding protein
VPLSDPAVEHSRRRIILQGDVPGPMDLSSGCLFASRCPIATEHCQTEMPPLVPHGDDGCMVSCILAAEAAELMPFTSAAVQDRTKGGVRLSNEVVLRTISGP